MIRALSCAVLFGLCLCTAVAAAPPCPPPEGGSLAGLHFKGRGDGQCLDPVRISGTRKTGSGVGGIKAWLASCRPGTRIFEQGVRRDGGKTFEVIELHRKGAEPERVCFDITAYFGRW